MKTTFVLSVSSAAGDTGAVATLDWEAGENIDADGNVRSSFLPGEEVVFLVNCPEGYRATEVIVHSKCGDGYIESGNVTRSSSERAGFDSKSRVANLSYWPTTSPEVVLFTVPETKMRYSLSGRQLSPLPTEELPVEAVIDYRLSCQRVRYIPPAALQLTGSDDVFPVRIEIIISSV